MPREGGEANRKTTRSEELHRKGINRWVRVVRKDAKLNEANLKKLVEEAVAKELAKNKASYSLAEVSTHVIQDAVTFPGAISRADRALAKIDYDQRAEENLIGEGNLALLKADIDRETQPYFNGIVTILKRNSEDAVKIPPKLKEVTIGKGPFKKTKTIEEEQHPGWVYHWEDLIQLGKESEYNPKTKFESDIFFDKNGLNPFTLDSYSLSFRREKIILGLGEAGIDSITLQGLGLGSQIGTSMLLLAPEIATQGGDNNIFAMNVLTGNIPKFSAYDTILKKHINKFDFRPTNLKLIFGEKPQILVTIGETRASSKNSTKKSVYYSFNEKNNNFRRDLTEKELSERSGEHRPSDIITREQFDAVLKSTLRILPTSK